MNVNVMPTSSCNIDKDVGDILNIMTTFKFWTWYFNIFLLLKLEFYSQLKSRLLVNEVSDFSQLIIISRLLVNAVSEI